MMRVLICGDRDWDKPQVIRLILEGLWSEFGKFTLIEGCARGADKVACEWAAMGVDHMHFPAQWDRYGRGAGPVRNRQQYEEGEPDVVFAFHDNLNESAGTKDMVEVAHDGGTPVYVIGRYNG